MTPARLKKLLEAGNRVRDAVDAAIDLERVIELKDAAIKRLKRQRQTLREKIHTLELKLMSRRAPAAVETICPKCGIRIDPHSCKTEGGF
jgi:DNA repair exonuclease SbcCD ATPase subunit